MDQRQGVKTRFGVGGQRGGDFSGVEKETEEDDHVGHAWPDQAVVDQGRGRAGSGPTGAAVGTVVQPNHAGVGRWEWE